MRPIDVQRTKQCGFTLMEVLVAMVVFSIGLLGIATLQMTGMKQTHNSHIRSVAVAQAEAMADRMRANKKAVDDGDYNVGAAGAPLASMPDDTDIATDCELSQCTAAEMAIYDLVQWNDPTDHFTGVGLDDALPAGSGMVCIDSTPDDGDSTDWQCDYSGDVYAIKVQWTERGLDENEADTETKRFVMRVRP
jgi:type IV pilus assembly protein PilV